ncbi:MAG TPA: ice-binding family protein [Polyangiaceae bacterium]|jgi:hypothetical protein
MKMHWMLACTVACGSSGATATDDGGHPSDGGIHGDGAGTGDSGTTGDGASTGDDASTADGGGTGDAANMASPPAVDLGAAGNYVILAMSGISTVPTSAVTGNLGLSPAAASYITGFPLTADSTNVFSTSPQVTGRIYASDFAPPTPSNLTTAVSDMQTAFTDAAGRAADVTELGAGNIGGMTLTRGVYKWGTGLLIPTDVTLAGSATDVWIFQIAQDLTMSSATTVHLTGGAVPSNVFWEVAGLVDLGTTAHFEGVLLTQTSVALRTGASIHGRLLAQTAVTIDGSAVVQPAL